ncbi:MAG: phosphatase PAP2 family protein [Candidatus Sericytochromatia bacterium]|uniref:Phosphatase PAP2 family protein n=1 Tax=Candidatus Tanganyikabacteria bacterium TaxID=2961651 RepID=A0A937X778_9BACT|nr:phosphatase PAP2 family protein [Candidatus Tanganyikabacteria bacterium]
MSDIATASHYLNEAFPFDGPTVSYVNSAWASPPLDAAMTVVSHRMVLVAAPLAAVPYTYATRGSRPALELAGTAAAAEITSGLASFGLKALIDRPRPYETLTTLRTPAGGEDSKSFPSGHAALSFAWAPVVAYDEPALAIPAYLLAGTITFSRLYLGVHYPSDLVFGAIIGLASGYGTIALRESLIKSGVLPAR